VNWRAFAAGAAVAALVALIAGIVVVLLDSTEDASLAAVAESTLEPSTTLVSSEVSTAETVPGIRFLEVDVAAAIEDPCSLLTGALLDRLDVDGDVEPDGDGRCASGDGDDAVVVAVQADDDSPLVAGPAFELQYGDSVEAVGNLGMAYLVRQGDRSLLAVFGPGYGVHLNLPTGDIDADLLATIRQALLEGPDA
jgi:hypothetical protein